MLTKWDKREESGENMIRDADIIFEMLSGGLEENMKINSMILLPTEIYTDNA